MAAIGPRRNWVAFMILTPSVSPWLTAADTDTPARRSPPRDPWSPPRGIRVDVGHLRPFLAGGLPAGVVGRGGQPGGEQCAVAGVADPGGHGEPHGHAVDVRLGPLGDVQ